MIFLYMYNSLLSFTWFYILSTSVETSWRVWHVSQQKLTFLEHLVSPSSYRRYMLPHFIAIRLLQNTSSRSGRYATYTQKSYWNELALLRNMTHVSRVWTILSWLQIAYMQTFEEVYKEKQFSLTSMYSYCYEIALNKLLAIR